MGRLGAKLGPNSNDERALCGSVMPPSTKILGDSGFSKLFGITRTDPCNHILSALKLMPTNAFAFIDVTHIHNVNMIILTNKAGPSSAPFMVLLLVSMSTVFGCGVIPGGESNE
ncbi:hypothetical protein KIN20_025277 [Parelaphostrongylus tenuis]|uniref:Uncharacterized protein n=1 Tax=Parelaphostrongylus tenuis TaxID=148309 RepID=A0AAD5MZB0_PARTN|nr:hypothetical protein KIN20_025277 [Parelaphostrongylus tenuis]